MGYETFNDTVEIVLVTKRCRTRRLEGTRDSYKLACHSPFLNIFCIYSNIKLLLTQLNYYKKKYPYEKKKVPLDSIFKIFASKDILVILLCF